MVLLGHSFISRAWRFLEDTGRPFCPGYTTTFIGRGSLQLHQTRPLLDQFIAQTHANIGAITLHIGGNDIVPLGCKGWRHAFAELVLYIRARLPRTRVIWSDMIPRLCWRGARSAVAIEHARRTLQVAARSIVYAEQGAAIRHPQIQAALHLGADGVHLNDEGYTIFLKNIEDWVQSHLPKQG